ncbi:MAG TPA: hypothetical protein PKA16_08345 [Ottowia sp.]|uniref:hypothetical protein n=1 Tax=Ottowia sp. TaxID=1898956 RepID=UPI002BB333B0|nr:hypothetical protein [Ottowia sp.]HMN21390.1 hypothetical protein [Ottowia sp.]
MKTSIRNFLIPALAVAALATASGGTALAQASAHDHDSAAPHVLSLNDGRKWPTDAPLRAGMKNIRDLVAPELAAAHAGNLDAARYQQLAARIESEVGGIVANCKLEPEADAMLHLVIADISQGADAMAGKDAQLRPALGLTKVARAVNQYGSHFDDAGFKPLADGH